MGELSESEESSLLSHDLHYQLEYDLKRRMGELKCTYEEFVVTKKLKKTFERFDIGVDWRRRAQKEAITKIFEKHRKALDNLDD